MAQHLFIVSRQQPDLFSYLTREFSAEPDVTIIDDRRQGERRTRSDEADGAADNRRQRDRRLKAELESNLSTLGYAFVRIA